MGDCICFNESRNGFVPLFCFNWNVLFKIDPGFVVDNPSLLYLALDGAIRRSMVAGDTESNFSVISFERVRFV